MKRKCVKYDLAEFCDLFQIERKFENIELYIDQDFEPDFIELLNQPKNKRRFARIVYVIVNGQTIEDLYRIEKYGIKAMKFTQNNCRVYCKEYNVKGKKVVAITSVNKKSQKLDKKLDSLLKAISKYDYDLQ